ncbi:MULTISPECIES: RNA chaperone Hfq [unclassified Desulfurobacterium]|uniref:RNA chaperone Hfq n=1 Tax=Desulfurobacterium sp. TC5-1 TaxID=1158318 RepID=UPI0003B59C31|nr:RNA chaperone Hfq [Desulfurobacterium sp. TC5-1]
MSAAAKHEMVKNWIRQYLKEFGEYNGTFEELANLTKTSAYLVKKAINELEEEDFLTAESKRGKGLTLKLNEKEPIKETISETAEKIAEEEKETKETGETKTEKKKRKTSLQDEVLSSLLGKDITVFLISGTRLEGQLLDFDNFTLSMTAPKGRSLVYKHAIATIIYG